MTAGRTQNPCPEGFRGSKRPLVLFDGPRVLVSTGEIRGAYPLPLSVMSDGCECLADESDSDVERWQTNLRETGIQQLQGNAANILRRDSFDSPNATQS